MLEVERLQALVRRHGPGAVRHLHRPCRRSGKVTALIGPSGCGKSTLLRSVNRMNDLLDEVRTEGDMKPEGESIYGPSVDVIELRKRMGMVFQKPNPFPMSIYENVIYALRIDGERDRSTCSTRSCETSACVTPALWDEVEGPPEGQRPRPLGRPAAAPVHRARDRGRARGAADGRAVLGARPDRHRPHRGSDRRAQGSIHGPDRDPQHAAGVAAPATTPPSCTVGTPDRVRGTTQDIFTLSPT